ncbi:hypothetical protein [Flavobacterium hydrophilum]|uniref:Lipocalin-like domain-containing protein n=1 Tax=Flavobacterium hydrophilum TaxID=2211445 RepID=A0A2V4C5X5_9FLAO|nr:hypothetical protein [Flavobacterium hydrophilum]PXY46575.1 hypothetical protein DMB68_05245 [Flavobacterium hydrophilum]
MKKIGLLLVLLVSLVSCSNDDSDNKKQPVVTNYYGIWIQYTEPRFANDPSSNQFSYIFKKDNTFSKTRLYENINTTLTGTFEIIKKDNVTQFILTYKEYNPLISNCSSGLIESFTLESGHLVDDARACDRSYVFKKIY